MGKCKYQMMKSLGVRCIWTPGRNAKLKENMSVTDNLSETLRILKDIGIES